MAVNSDVQQAFNIFDNNFEKGLGAVRTKADLENMKSAIQKDTSLSAEDKSQLMEDVAALEPLLGVSGQGGAWQSAVTNLVNGITAKTGSVPTKVTQDAQTGGRVDDSLPQSWGPFSASQTAEPTGTGANISSGSDFLNLLRNNPDFASSLKQYVKSQAQQSLLDSVLKALGNASGGSTDLTSSPSSSSKRVSSANVATAGDAASTSATDDGLNFVEGGLVQQDTGPIPVVNSSIQLTSGGAQSGNGNSASLDAWDSKLGLSNPGNIDEFLMMVLLASYEDGQKGLEDMAKELQKTNEQKKGLRSQLAGLYNQKTGNENADTTVDAQIQNVQGQLSSASDDAQLQQLQLQNATQNQQQLLQEISSFSKDLYDASMNILRKIGG